MHAFSRESFDFPPSSRQSVSSPSSLTTTCSTCVAVGEDIHTRILKLAQSSSDGSHGEPSQLVSAGSSGPSRRYSCVHWTILPVRSDRPGEPSQLPPLPRKETETGEEGSESEEEGRVDLNLLMDGRDSAISVDLGDGGLGQVSPLNINRRITQRSLSDAGEVAATNRLLEKSNTIKKVQEDISVDDSAVTYTETETEEPAPPSRVRKYFRLPKLEFRDHVPFHPPAHSVGAPRHPRQDSDSVEPDNSSRRESSTHPSTEIGRAHV